MPSFSSLRATAWFRLRHLTGAGPPLGERAGRRIPARSSSGRFPWRRPRPGHGYALEDADDLLVAGVKRSGNMILTAGDQALSDSAGHSLRRAWLLCSDYN